MRFLPLACRIFLGIIFVVFGANNIHAFIHMPTPPAGTVIGDWTNIMMASHWILVVGLVMFIGGVLVLIGGTAPAGLVMLAPVIFNILCFHMLLAGGKGIGMAVFVALLEVLLLYFYRSSFAGILSTNAEPVVKPRRVSAEVSA